MSTMDAVNVIPGVVPLMIAPGTGFAMSKDIEAIVASNGSTRDTPQGAGDVVKNYEKLHVAADPGIPQAENENGNMSQRSSQDTPSRDSESEASTSKAIVFFQKGQRGCNPHKFGWTETQNMLGKGAYGEVFKVQCTSCRQEYACKVIRFAHSFNKAARAKHIQAVDSELRCYMMLSHPHIIKYVHHVLTERKMQIFTEYCESRDLESAFSGHSRSECFDAVAWTFFEGLASALSRCHYGLRATENESELLSEYVDFEPEWEPILHRDIKPGNVLLAWRGQPPEPVLKLGDFGTSFKLEEGGKPPSTQQVGTKIYWPPEILETEKKLEGRTTEWSAKADVWGIGAVMHRLLTSHIPSNEVQEKSLEGRLRGFRSLLPAESGPISDLMAHVICECLALEPTDRPTSLQLLAVAAKYDTSNRGLKRSASFWKALSRHQDVAVASSVTKHFVSIYLPLLAADKVLFSAREVAIIMSLVQIHCRGYLSACSRHLSAGFLGNLAGSTVFHALASVPPDEQSTIQLALDESQWPQAKEISHVALKKNSLGLLPSACAAGRQNTALAVRLTELEEQIRTETARRAQANALNTQETRLKDAAGKEFDLMFKLLSRGHAGRFSVSAPFAARAMTETAQLGYCNVVRKLIELGVSPSVHGRRRETALHIFSHEGNANMVRFLLDHGAEVDARDEDSSTPLHWAAWAGNLDAVKELLARRADINAVDRKGRTALFGAAGAGFANVVRLLLQRGADAEIRGGTRMETPLERADKRMHEDVVLLLQGHNATAL